MGVTLYLWMVDLVYFHGKIPQKWMITGGNPMTQETSILKQFWIPRIPLHWNPELGRKMIRE